MADAQFAIDIAANMPGGAATVAQLDALSAKLLAGGKNSDVLVRAVSRVSQQLDDAQAAAQAARAELDQVTKTYSSLEREALAAEKAAAKYAALAGDYKKAFDTEQLARLQAEATRARSALDAHASVLGRVRERSRLAAAAEAQHADTLGNLGRLNQQVNATFARRSEQLGKMQAAFGLLGGPVGTYANKALGAAKVSSELTAALGASRASTLLVGGAVAGLTVGIALLTVAIAAGAIALTAWVVKQADAARATNLTREAIETLHPALRGLPIDRLAEDTGLAEDRLYAMARGFRAAGHSAAELPGLLRAAATAEAALGEDGLALFQKRMAATGNSAKATAREIETQFGGIVARKMLGLDAQTARFRRNISGMFEGLNIEPVLRGLSVMVGLFDKASATGRGMRMLIGGIFEPLIEHAEQAAQVVEAFALGVAIQLVKMYLLAKPLIRRVKDLFGFDDADSAFARGLDAAEVAGKALAAVIVPLTALLAGFVGTVMLVASAPLVLVGALVALGYGIAAGIDWIITKIGELYDWLAGIPWGDLATAMIDGFVNRITTGASRIIGAVTGVFSDAVKAAKRVLGINSPSKVTGEIADDSVDGYVIRMDRRAPDAQQALESAVAPRIEDGSVADRGFAPAGRSRSGPSVFGNTFHFYGVRDAENAAARLEEAFTRILEGDAASLSGDWEGAPA